MRNPACAWTLLLLIPHLLLASCSDSGQASYAHATSLRDAVVANPADQASLNELIGLLDDDHHLVNANAAGCLRQLGGNIQARPVVAPFVVPALAARIDRVGREATNALAAFGPEAQSAVPELIAAVQKYPNDDTGWFAAEALGNIGPPAVAAIPALEAAAKKPYIDKFATKALEIIRGAPNESWEMMEEVRRSSQSRPAAGN